jgi:hypothetical protein
MSAKKVKKTNYPFGIYNTEATLSYQDELDLEHYIERAYWDKMSDAQKERYLVDLIEGNCMPDIDYTYSYLRADNE